MSDVAELHSIERYFDTQWADRTPIIWGAHGGEAATDAQGVPIYSVRHKVDSGATLQGSIGRTKNRLDNIGMVTVTIYGPGGKGDVQHRAYRQVIKDMFHGVTLDTAGIPITQTADAFVRFSPPQLGDRRHPYIAASFADAPFHITNVIAPFVRYSLK